MKSLIALIFLFTMFSRVALAMPTGAGTCIGYDHISQNCHAPSADSPCEGSDQQTNIGAEDCIDLPPVWENGLTAKVTTDAQVLEALMVMSPILIELAVIGDPVHPRHSEDDSPSFCARSHSCCIVIRR